MQNMMDETRNNLILLQYNIEFGFCSNYLGASVYAIPIPIVIGLVSAILGWISFWSTILMSLFQVVLSVIAFIFLKHERNAYARQLFAAFMGKK